MLHIVTESLTKVIFMDKMNDQFDNIISYVDKLTPVIRQ